MRGTGAERPVRAMKSGKLDGAKGSRHPACPDGQPRAREEPSSHAKPFRISKWVVWEAYTRVKANHGAAGVDAESVEMFEQDLKNNLYRIWNRMGCGSSSSTVFSPVHRHFRSRTVPFLFILRGDRDPDSPTRLFRAASPS